MTTTTLETLPARDMSGAEDMDTFHASTTKSRGSIRATSRVVSARVDEAGIPGWVYRRFAWPHGENPAPLVPVRHAEGRCGTARVPPVHTPEPTVSDLVHVALLRTGYPLHHIRCWSDEETLTLSGFVTRYYYAQIALETALRLAKGRRIETHIDVLPAPDREQWDD